MADARRLRLRCFFDRVALAFFAARQPASVRGRTTDRGELFVLGFAFGFQAGRFAASSRPRRCPPHDGRASDDIAVHGFHVRLSMQRRLPSELTMSGPPVKSRHRPPSAISGDIYGSHRGAAPAYERARGFRALQARPLSVHPQQPVVERRRFGGPRSLDHGRLSSIFGASRPRGVPQGLASVWRSSAGLAPHADGRPRHEGRKTPKTIGPAAARAGSFRRCR